VTTTVAPPSVEVSRYDAPAVRRRPVTEVIPSEPVADSHAPGRYQHVLLHTRTGELRFHESTQHREVWDSDWTAINDVPGETWKRWHPGTRFTGVGPHMWFQPVPELVSWTVDSGSSPDDPYLDVEGANDLLELIEPYAQQLLAGLYEADGDLDWSADAARAGRQITRLCSRHRQPAAPEVDGDLADYSDIVHSHPQAYRPWMLTLGLQRLAEECEDITRYLGSPHPAWHPEIAQALGVPEPGGHPRLEVLGVRSWYLTALLHGDPRPTLEWADWDAQHRRLDSGEISSSSTDEELEAWATREETRAADAGVRLLGAVEAVYDHRGHLRRRDWDRLAVVGTELSRLEALRAERSELVARAMRWGYGDSDIASRARMSRQAVHKARQAGQPED
jgi:hypothetical protein